MFYDIRTGAMSELNHKVWPAGTCCFVTATNYLVYELSLNTLGKCILPQIDMIAWHVNYAKSFSFTEALVSI